LRALSRGALPSVKIDKDNMKKTAWIILCDAHFWIPVGVLAGGVCLLMILR
jgi:hypothetical protein